MELNTVLTIVGIIATVSGSIVAIIMAARHKYKGRLDLIVDENINLYNSIVKRIDDLKILYKNQPIKENMNLIKIFLINSGAKDFTPETAELCPTISFDKESIIHNVNIISQSHELKARCELKNNVVSIIDGLIRCNEYLYFEVLVQTKEKHNPEDIIQFNYRTSDFEKKEPREKSKLRVDFANTFMVFTTLLICVVLFNTFYNPLKIKHSKLYSEIENPIDSDTRMIFPTAVYDNSLPKIDIPDSTFKKIIKQFREFPDNYSLFDILIKPERRKIIIDGYIVRYKYDDNIGFLFLVFSPIFLLITFLTFIWQWFRHRKDRLLLKRVNEILEEINSLIISN